MSRNIIFTIFITIITFSSILSSCQFNDKETDKEEYRITNINIYKNTIAWELALAVKNQKTKTIEKIAKDNLNLLNYQEPKYEATLLLWAVGMERYKSAETLLKCGADPNITSNTEWKTPLFLAAGFSWIDYYAKNDPKYVKLLLSYGADPNKNYNESEKFIIEPGASPLMHSIGRGIEKTKALVEAGVDINYKTKTGNTAAVEALLFEWIPEYAHYLIVEKKARVSEPYYRGKGYGKGDPNEKFFPVDLLRDWVYDLDSERYKMKMEIVEEFARQGVDYWDTKIYKNTLEKIKKLYPDTWEEYIKRY
jgi:hypothetical protein